MQIDRKVIEKAGTSKSQRNKGLSKKEKIGRGFGNTTLKEERGRIVYSH